MTETLFGFFGSGVTIAATILVLLGGRFILRKAVKDKRTLPYHRQFYTALIALAGLFVTVALLPLPTEIRTQILSVIGILISAIIALSSTTLVGNAMAGVMLRLTKGFRAGDFIEFEELLGRVTDIGLFHTEVQLITRDIVTVPNLLLVQKAVRVTRKAGTFVNAAVSLGYSVSRQSAEEALKHAAEKSGLTDPFVLVEDLLDHAVCYRVYGLLEESSELLSRSSQLRAAILDTLHEAQLEIASPSLVDRREHPTHHHYIPPSLVQTSAGEAENPSEEIEEVAFDRAEEAASIEQLYAVREKLSHEMGTLEDSDARSRKAAIREELKSIDEEISRRETRKEEERLDENASE